MRSRILMISALVACVAAPAMAGAALVLRDGQTIEGQAVERRDGLYLLELEGGDVLPVPAELVVQLRLTGDDDPAPGGIRVAKPETLAGPPDGPRLLRPSEQREVLGRPAEFVQDVIDPRWRPEREWPGADTLIGFNPARWYEAPIESGWTPRSAYKASGDVTEFNPARWYRGPVDPTWWPTDGFATRPAWFRPLFERR